MEALAAVGSKGLDAIGLCSAVTAAESAGQPADGLLPGLLRETSKQLIFACMWGASAASTRAHAASTGGLDSLEGYGLLHLGALVVARARVREPSIAEFRTINLAESHVLQSLCDLGRPCTRDVLEHLAVGTHFSDQQEDARRALGELLDFDAWLSLVPVQATAQRLAAWTSLELRGLDWHLSQPLQVAFGSRRGEKRRRAT